MKFAVSAGLLSIAIIVAYTFWWSEPSYVLEGDGWNSTSVSEDATQESAARQPAASEDLPENQVDQPVAGEGDSLESLVANLEIDSGFMSDLGQGESAQVVRGLFHLLERAAGGDEEALKLHALLLAKIKSSSEGYGHILEAIKRWQDYPERSFDRVGLLEILAESNEFKDEVNAIAKKEMVDNGSKEVTMPDQAATEEELDESLSTTHDMYAPVTAHRIFLETAGDGPQALEGSMMAIEAQDNHNVREAMIQDFKEIHPDEVEELLRYLRSRGIDLIETNHQDNEE